MTRSPSPSTPTWITTVDEIVRIFRDALYAIAPVLERAQIYSDVLRGHDDWDEIAQALFENIVVRSIQWSEEASLDIDLGRYATIGVSSLEAPHLVVRDESTVEWGIFHAIVSRERPFDSVEMLKPGEMATRETQYEKARFALRIPGRDGLIETLTVQL